MCIVVLLPHKRDSLRSHPRHLSIIASLSHAVIHFIQFVAKRAHILDCLSSSLLVVRLLLVIVGVAFGLRRAQHGALSQILSNRVFDRTHIVLRLPAILLV